MSVIGLITRPEGSCVNEEFLTRRRLSHQIKYSVSHSGRTPADMARSNSTEAWMSICCRADHSSRGIVACE
jgi:hypothetical protein